MTEHITWGGFKQHIEQMGVNDDDAILSIDVDGIDMARRNFTVYRRDPDEAVTITHGT